MTERRLVAIAAVGAALMAYAVYVLLGRNPPEAPPHAATPDDPRSASAREGTPGPRTRSNSTRSRSANGPGDPPPGIERWDPAAPAGDPADKPPLPSSLEEAREDYDDLKAELERELQRTRDTGRPLPGDDWVEYYARFHDTMNPLRALLSPTDAAHQAELTEKSEAMRGLLDALQEPPADEPQ